MKNVAPLMLAATLTLSSFSAYKSNDLLPAEVTAREFVSALRQSSEAKFITLFPTLAQFHTQMDENKGLYGANLNAAKEDFAITYDTELLPAIRRAYATLIAQAKERGINWSKVNIVSIDIDGAGSMTITLDHEGHNFDLLVRRSLMIEGKWKVSQYIRFV